MEKSKDKVKVKVKVRVKLKVFSVVNDVKLMAPFPHGSKKKRTNSCLLLRPVLYDTLLGGIVCHRAAPNARPLYFTGLHKKKFKN